MDIGAWLRGLGLERYEAAFRENRIEADVLANLTVEDLKDLGVTLVGDRRRLLGAIAKLGVEASTAPGDAALRPSLPTAPTDGSPLPNLPLPGLVPRITGEGRVGAEAERRQLSVMFCDLVGSTALSAHLDPEDLREVIAVYHRVVADAVRTFDGFVAKYMGDASSFISATRRRMRMMPSGRCAPA